MESTAQKFNFARLDDTKPLLSEHGFGGVVDISNAYRSINIYPPHRKYMGFAWKIDGQDKWFCDNALCFGIRSAPYIFNCVSDFVAHNLSNQGVHCINYLDDFFIAGETADTCASKQSMLIDRLTYMGFKVNYRKVLLPSHNPRYLGVVIDLNAMCFRLPTDKLVRTKTAVKDMLLKKHASRKAIERLTGLLAHCAKLVWGGRTFCRRLYGLLKATQGKRRLSITLTFKQDLKWWDSFLTVFDGSCKICPNEHIKHDFERSQLQHSSHGFNKRIVLVLCNIQYQVNSDVYCL